MTSQKKTKYYNPAFILNYLLDSDDLCLLDDHKTYGKTFLVDSCSNYDVTLKKLNITIQLLFKNFMLDSHENSYKSRLV